MNAATHPAGCFVTSEWEINELTWSISISFSTKIPIFIVSAIKDERVHAAVRWWSAEVPNKHTEGEVMMWVIPLLYLFYCP